MLSLRFSNTIKKFHLKINFLPQQTLAPETCSPSVMITLLIAQRTDLGGRTQEVPATVTSRRASERLGTC